VKFPEKFRWQRMHHPMDSEIGDPYGVFIVKYKGKRLKVVATDGISYREEEKQDTGWEHVSVSNMDNIKSTPTWDDMCHIKNLFWSDDEWAVQFHPAKSDYVNNHPGCLHLWRSTKAEMPLPPKEFV